MFEVVDGSLTVAATCEVYFSGQPFVVKLLETRGGETKRVKKGDNDGTLVLLTAAKKRSKTRSD